MNNQLNTPNFTSISARVERLRPIDDESYHPEGDWVIKDGERVIVSSSSSIEEINAATQLEGATFLGTSHTGKTWIRGTITSSYCQPDEYYPEMFSALRITLENVEGRKPSHAGMRLNAWSAFLEKAYYCGSVRELAGMDLFEAQSRIQEMHI